MTANLLTWVLSASALIAVVLLLRGLLGKRISAGLRYGLWAVVLARLLIPLSISLAVTVPQIPDWTPAETMREKSIYVLPVDSYPVENSGVLVRDDGTLLDPSSFGYPRLTSDGERVVRYADKISPLELLGWIWAAGSAVFALALLTANLRFSVRLRRVRRPLEGCGMPVPVYVAPALPSPCLMGLFRPAVYVTEEAAGDPDMLRHVLAHELTHYNHRDHLWSALRGAALAVHWWNPLVWLAVVCSRRDGELACDEGALKQLGDKERTAYGETLLTLVTTKSKPGDLLCFATTMTGGKRSLQERIQRIAKQPKRLASAMVVVIVVLSLSVLVAFGQAKKTAGSGGNTAPPETRTDRPSDAWKTAVITVDDKGVPHIDYEYGDTMEFLDGNPIPAPREWAGQEGRNEAVALEGASDVWAKLVSPTDGWLVAWCGRGAAAADSYVYKTEDGGMNWEEVEQPDRQLLSNLFAGEMSRMNTGDGEGDPAVYTMLSSLQWTKEVDLDHDGLPDRLNLWYTADTGFDMWTLQFTASYMSSPTWEDSAGTSHVGWCAFFLCHVDGEDYLLRYVPYMGGGGCEYRYQLFYLTADGREVVVQENSLRFDLIFMPEYAEQHQYDPWAINAFMEEINALLEKSELLLNTDQNLQGTFDKEGRLYDSLWWLDEDDGRDENLSLLDNLLNYGNYAQDHPDDVWSPLADLLSNLTKEDITAYAGDISELVRLLRGAERGSRFYPADSYDEAYDGHGAGEYDGGQRHVSLADGSTLHLIASRKSDNVLMILETSSGTTSAFYTAPELNEQIRNDTQD